MKKLEKVNLLNFQKSLNEQFSQIFDTSSSGVGFSQGNSNLGLINKIKHFNIYFPLNDLKNIANNSYEEIKIAKSWIVGISQVHGEVYTILNLEKVFELLTIKKSDYAHKNVENDTNIVYLKEYKENNIGLIINKLDLLNISTFRPLLTYEQNELDFTWKYNENLVYEDVVKEFNSGELILVNKIKKLADSKSSLLFANSDKQSPELMLYLFKNIYLNNENKLIFVLNIEMLITILGSIPPF